MVENGNGEGVDLLDRFDSLNNTWNVSRYQKLVADIETLETKLGAFKYKPNSVGGKDWVEIDANVSIAGDLIVEENMFVAEVLNQTN